MLSCQKGELQDGGITTPHLAAYTFWIFSSGGQVRSWGTSSGYDSLNQRVPYVGSTPWEPGTTWCSQQLR